ncbi:Glutamate N-acetyltransferase @ N-acetylglutamate synthase [hydrothermal vent metagenome]|uniref:glutamate N-acetyltransferase n=1 Tax=hydrothermal vent metagenome TaxID=652676 RepID=A0A3B1D8F8_9ZZZZ
MKPTIKIIQGGITAVDGFMAAGLAAGIKKNKVSDMALIYSDKPCSVAALFTKNKFPAPPLVLNKKHLKKGIGQAIIINSGNANAFTGEQGKKDAKAMALETAQHLNIPLETVYVASTGVISQLLPMEKIQPAIPKLYSMLSKKGSHAAAEAIMTTDTWAKECAFEGFVGKNVVRIGGITKGSGMIHPNMATMLAFLSTDVLMTQTLLQSALREAVDLSFHRITIDRDTSTNDMVLLFSNGKQGNIINKKGTRYKQFTSLLTTACTTLAKMLIQDAEGATKCVSIEVEGAKNEKAASKIAFAIANSLLVKTAFFGEDANWGRIIAAIGNSEVKVRPEEISLFFGPIQLVKNGIYLGLQAEDKITEYLKSKEIILKLKLQSGRDKACVWTSDLSLDYVKINALYRT